MRTTDVLNLLADQLADAETAWSLGTFGAIAEFTRDADEGVTLDRDDRSVSAVTAVRHSQRNCGTGSDDRYSCPTTGL